MPQDPPSQSLVPPLPPQPVVSDVHGIDVGYSDTVPTQTGFVKASGVVG